MIAPEGDEVRPTGDRVRESLFNSLGSMGVLLDADVLDLFGGSGALGIEAMSRGAASAVFVDRSTGALDAIRTNLVTCGFDDVSTVIRSDAAQYLGSLGASFRFDIAFIDPPYAFDDWSELLDGLPAELVVIESDREIAPGDGWDVVRQKRYGGTVVTIARSLEQEVGAAPISEIPS